MAETAGGWDGVSLWLLSQHKVDTETAGEYHYSSTGVYGVSFALQQADASHFLSVFLLRLKMFPARIERHRHDLFRHYDTD